MNHRLSSLTLSIFAISLSQFLVPIATHAEVFQLKTSSNQDFSQMFFFGDSLSDSGYYTKFNPALGKFTTNPDQVWTETLAQSYGFDSIPNNGVTGNNYAVGGAVTKGYVPSDEINEKLGNLPMPSVDTQVNNYLDRLNNGKVDPNALYSVWVGANNMLNIPTGATQSTAIGAMTLAANDAAKTVQNLSDAGAKYILVPNIPDVGLSPMAILGNKSESSTQLTAYYNSALYSTLDNGTANVIPIDTFSMLQEVVKNPSFYGMTNVTDPACGFNPDHTEINTSLLCDKSKLDVDSSQYLFADGVHPTGAVHDIIAGYTESVLETPSQYAKTANIVTQSGWMQDLQLNRRMAQLYKGKHGVWAEGVFLNSQGGTTSEGASYESDSVDGSGIIGAGLALGEHSQTGMYLQRQQADYQLNTNVNTGIEQTGFGVYHTHNIDIKGQGYLLDVHAGIDKLNIDWERDVQLGGGIRTHIAEGGGRRKHVSLQLGREFNLDAIGRKSGEKSEHSSLKVTPYMGVLLQEVRINSLVEDSPTTSTSMKFDSYDQDSLLGSVGVQLDYPINEKYGVIGDFRYSHDFKDDAADKVVTSHLQSVTAYSRGFDLPVLGSTESDNFGMSLSINTKLTPTIDFQIGVTAQGASGDDYQAGALVGMNASF